MSRMPRRPLHELLVAVAGPLVNVVIVLLLMLIMGLAWALRQFEPESIARTATCSGIRT